MKKGLGLISLVLSSVFVLSVPASAATLLASDGFSTGKDKNGTSKNEWVTDRYEPEEFDIYDNTLYISVGPKGYYKSRPEDQKSKYYALQGRKMVVDKMPTTNTWTATVKINIDDAWLTSDSFTKKAQFSLELVDGDGNAIEQQPAIALLKSNSRSPVLQYANPSTNTGWGTAYTYVNGDNDKEELILEDGWHTLLIKANKGVISYYFDEKKVGNFNLSQKDVYPSYMALNVYNYERTAVAQFDNLYLYDGAYGITQRSSSAQDKVDERREEQYEKKRNKWEDKYELYRFSVDCTVGTKSIKSGDDVSAASLKSALKISNGNYLSEDFNHANHQLGLRLDALSLSEGSDYKTRTSKDMPDSYWDY